jgi:membrane protease YdiL (CAAX protease family)
MAFAASWGIGGAGLLINHSFPNARALATASPLYYLAAYSISGIGVILTAVFFRADGLRDLARRLVPRPADTWAYVVVVVIYVAITSIAIVAAHGIAPLTRLSWTAVIYHLPLVALRDPGPIGEEFGWRGFALPRLLAHASPLQASIQLGVVHTLWHAPLFLIPGMPQAQVSFPAFAVGVIAIAILDTFLYLRTTGNLLLAILVHLLANACGDIAKAFDALTPFFLLEGAVALLLVAGGALKTSRAPTATSLAPTG